MFADFAEERGRGADEGSGGERSFSPVPVAVPLEEDDDDKLLAKFDATAVLTQQQMDMQDMVLRKVVLMMIKAGRQGELHPGFCKSQIERGISAREQDFLRKAKAAHDAEDEEEQE